MRFRPDKLPNRIHGFATGVHDTRLRMAHQRLSSFVSSTFPVNAGVVFPLHYSLQLKSITDLISSA